MVFIYSLALAKNIQNSPEVKKVTFRVGDFLTFYAASLLLSIKLVIDTEKWYLEDFTNVSKIKEKLLHEAELMICSDILNYNINIKPARLASLG